MVCLGGEISGAAMYTILSDDRWYEYKMLMALTAFFLTCLAFKNFINIFQWIGGS